MVPSTLYAYASSTVAFQQSRSGCNAKSTKTGRNPHGTARSRRQWNRIPNKKTSACRIIRPLSTISQHTRITQQMDGGL